MVSTGTGPRSRSRSLIVPGAGDNASRSAVPAISELRQRGYGCFSITFAHPHGDNYVQAQQIANAVARIREVTGASQVDIIAHSKGATATAIYLANQDLQTGATTTPVAASTPGTAPSSLMTCVASSNWAPPTCPAWIPPTVGPLATTCGSTTWR